MRGRNLQPKTLYPARLSYRLDRKIKSFIVRQKILEFSTIRPALQQILKELFQVEKKRPLLETRKLHMEKLTNKGKHAVKIGNHLHTNMIWKPAVVRKESSLK